MKILAILGLVFAVLGQSAKAEQMQLVTITTDAPGHVGEVYQMGFNMDASHSAVGIYYHDETAPDPTRKTLNFSFAQLAAAPQVLITRPYAGRNLNVAAIQYANNKLTIRYKNDARKDDWSSSKIYNVSCDDTYNNCHVVDADTGSATTHVFIKSYKTRIALLVNVVTGIAEIDSL